MNGSSDVRLEQQIAEVEQLISRHRLLESVARRQQTPRSALLEEMQRRQNLVELHMRLRALHPADVAHLLESVPQNDRAVIWEHLAPPAAGAALVEVNPALRESLIEITPPDRLRTVLLELDTDDLRYLSESLPEAIFRDVAASLDATDRSWVEQSQLYPEGTAARLMTQDVLSPHGDQSATEAVSMVRGHGELPTYTDRLFVVDSRNVLIGAVPLGVLLIADAASPISTLMETEIRRFHPDDSADRSRRRSSATTCCPRRLSMIGAS